MGSLLVANTNREMRAITPKTNGRIEPGKSYAWFWKNGDLTF